MNNKKRNITSIYIKLKIKLKHKFFKEIAILDNETQVMDFFSKLNAEGIEMVKFGPLMFAKSEFQYATYEIKEFSKWVKNHQ